MMMNSKHDFNAPALIKAAVFAGLLTLGLTASLPRSASAQDAVLSPARVQNTAPFLAEPGEQVLVCAANVSAETGQPQVLHISLEVLSAVSGAVVSRGEIALAPLGGLEHPPEPCIEFVVTGDAASSVPSASLLMARVELSPQPLPPGFRLRWALTASVQIVTPEASGDHIRGVMFYPPEPCLSAACGAADLQ